MNYYKLKVLKELSLANMDEQEAIAKYYELYKISLEAFNQTGITGKEYNDIIDIIEIAIAEELKHAKLLEKLSIKLSEIEPEGG